MKLLCGLNKSSGVAILTPATFPLSRLHCFLIIISSEVHMIRCVDMHLLQCLHSLCRLLQTQIQTSQFQIHRRHIKRVGGVVNTVERGAFRDEAAQWIQEETRCERQSLWVRLPVRLNDLFSIAHGSVPVLHVEADAHGLVHHVKHVNVGVCEYCSHLLQAELAHLQQVTGGCQSQGIKRER